MRLVAATILLLGALACSGARRDPPPALDGEAPLPKDAGPTAAIDSGGAPPAPDSRDGAVESILPGRQLMPAGGSARLAGVTSDGLAILYDLFTGVVNAVPLSGRSPFPITRLPNGLGGAVSTFGAAVSITQSLHGAALFSTTTIWTAAHGGNLLSSMGNANDVRVSENGQGVLFVDGASGSASWLVFQAIDGTRRTSLMRFSVVPIRVGERTLTPCGQYEFAGSSVIVAHCEPTAEVQRIDAFVSVFAAPTWRRTMQIPVRDPGFVASADASRVLVQTQAGLQVFPVAGGRGDTIDADGQLGVFSRDGKTVLYTTTREELKRASLGDATMTVTLGNDAAAILAVSPDEKSLITAATSGSENAQLALRSAVEPASPLYQADGLTPARDAFTANSEYALFETGPRSLRGLRAVSSRATSKPFMLADDRSGVQDVRAVDGSKVLFNTGDLDHNLLWIADVAQGKPTMPFVTGVDTVILTPGRDRILYAWHFQPGPLAGLWITPIP